MLPRRATATALAGLLIALLLACPLALGVTTANPAAPSRWYHSPILLGRHMFSAGLIPCGPASPGQLIVAHNAFISSRYPPPGIYLSTSPPCP